MSVHGGVAEVPSSQGLIDAFYCWGPDGGIFDIIADEGTEGAGGFTVVGNFDVWGYGVMRGVEASGLYYSVTVFSRADRDGYGLLGIEFHTRCVAPSQQDGLEGMVVV